MKEQQPILCLHLNGAFDAALKIIFLENVIHAGLDGDILDLELAERPQAKLIVTTNKRLIQEPALFIIFISDPEEAAHWRRIGLAFKLIQVPNTMHRQRKSMKTAQEIKK